MSYTFYSFKDRSQQDLEMWHNRTLESETESCNTRTLRSIFKKYIPQNAKIIEAGCGVGGWVNYFNQRDFEIVGIEYDKRIIAQAKSYDQEIPIEYGDVNALDVPDTSYDIYISLGVIEHFQAGPMEALLEAKRIMKPGGLAFITVPYLSIFRKIFAHPLRNFYFFIRHLKGKDDYFWEYRYTKKELLGFLEKAGLKPIFIGIDDYIESDKKHHIGLYADFFFLRKKNGEIWELNTVGKIILRLGRVFSPWLFCSGLHIIAKK